MILADKIIRLRRKNGWSQEELAEKMNVSRQAVSKWESAQTVPDLEKILMLGALFGVTTDYLLKDELESEEFTSGEDSAIRRLTLAEANEYLALRKTASVRMAAATFLCIVSVIPLLILSALAESPAYGILENTASAAGLIVLFLFIAAAVAAFLSCSFKNAPYAFLDKEPFDTEYGVTGMVSERQRQYKSTYARCNMVGTMLCILSPVPIFIGMAEGSDLAMILAVCGMLFLAGGVVCSKRLLNQAVWKSLRTHNLKPKKGAQVMRKNEKITALYERLSRDDFGKDDDQQRESNSISNQELLCRGWFLPPNTYDCGSFVVNGTAVVGKEPKKPYNRCKSTQKGAELYEISI